MNTSKLSIAEQKVTETIAHRLDAMFRDLRAFVAIPTGPGGHVGLGEFRDRLRSRLEKLGAHGELIPGDPKPTWLDPRPSNALVPPTLLAKRWRDPHAGHLRVLLSGHLDTVHDASGPFQELHVATNGKTATGPGCVDMKGGIVVGLHALESLEHCGVRVNWSFVLNSDEETGSYHSDRALRAVAKEHDVGLALEPATKDGGLVVERPGSGQFMIECHGKASHVGRDFTAGVSAVNMLAERILKVARMPRPEENLIASIGPLEGGHATNVVPDHARAWGNIRYPSQVHGEMLEGWIKALATPLNAMPRVTVQTSLNRPAKPETPETTRLATLAQRAAEDLGQNLPFGTTGGVCDGNNLQAAGLPTIDTLGVRGGGLHTNEEWIELSSLVERCQLLALLIMRLAGGAWSKG